MALNFHCRIALSIFRSRDLGSFQLLEFSESEDRSFSFPTPLSLSSVIFALRRVSFKNLACTLECDEEVRAGKRAISSST